MYKFMKILFAAGSIFLAISAVTAQTKSFTPVEAATLKAKIDNAVSQGRAQGRFWVGYQFEVRPGVGIDFEIVGPSGTISITNDGWSMMDDPRYETRELGFFMFYENERDRFTRAEIYNLKREHQFGGYPVYWAGRATNEESLNFLKSLVDVSVTDVSRLSDRAAFAIALHDDARVEALLTEMVRRPAPESIRNRALYWLGYTAESQSKNNMLAEIVRNQRESIDARQQALSALAMSRAATNLPVLQSLYETMTSRDLQRRALGGISRNDNRDGAATFLIRIAENEPDMELRKNALASLGRVPGEKSLNVLASTLDSSPYVDLQRTAVSAIARRPKDESIPILIKTARSHPRVEIRKIAIQALGHTGDERAIAVLNELLTK